MSHKHDHEVDIEAVVDLNDIITSLKELTDEELQERGLAVEGTWDEVDDPVLLGPGGTPVDTWREGYPYDERMTRQQYEIDKRLLQIELLKLQSWVKGTGAADRHGVRGTRRRRQGRHDQALHGAPEPARCPRRRPAEAVRAGAHPVVLPALHPAPAQRRRDRDVRPVLVQPRRGRAGDGLLHRRGVQGVHAPGARVRADARARRDHPRQVLVLGEPQGAGHPVHDPADRPGAAVEALPDMDLASLDRWQDYTDAKEAMLFYTDSEWAPWTVVRSNDKKRGRLEAIRWVLPRSTTRTRTPTSSAPRTR